MSSDASRAGKDSGFPPRTIALLVVGGLLLVLFAAWFSVSVMPRWWSHRVGDQVDGDLTTGGVLGFMYGFLATLLPIGVLALVGRYKRRSLWAWLIGGAGALLLASPVLITLGIVLGDGSAAHAAERTLDVDAPWFRGGMAFGVVAALALVVFGLYTTVTRRRARHAADEARARLDAERAAASPPDPGDAAER